MHLRVYPINVVERVYSGGLSKIEKRWLKLVYKISWANIWRQTQQLTNSTTLYILGSQCTVLCNTPRHSGGTMFFYFLTKFVFLFLSNRNQLSCWDHVTHYYVARCLIIFTPFQNFKHSHPCQIHIEMWFSSYDLKEKQRNFCCIFSYCLFLSLFFLLPPPPSTPKNKFVRSVTWDCVAKNNLLD